jgi:hypothetical protein
MPRGVVATGWLVATISLLLGSPLRADEPSCWLLHPLANRPLWEEPATREECWTVTADCPYAEFGLRRDPSGLLGRTQAEWNWGKYTAQTTLSEPLDEWHRLSHHPTWRSQEQLQLGLFGSMFVYGQMGGEGQADVGHYRLNGRTGIGWKWQPLPRGEVQLRGGPVVSYDSLLANRDQKLALELSARYPLVGDIRLEYTGVALPAITLTDRDQINQDVRVAVPLGEAGQIHVGARYRWEDTTHGPVGPDRAQLYFGLQLKR